MEHEKKSKWIQYGGVFLILGAGYMIGKQSVDTFPQEKIDCPLTREEPQLALVQLLRREGDLITVSLVGEGKVLVGNDISFEETGEHVFSWGNIPSSEDLELRNFPYLGNMKTRKFYNTDSYPARGTEVKYRRFFSSKEEAVAAGFIAAKNLK